MLGQISESIKKTISGDQKLINFFVNKFKSIGKNWWIIFFNFNFLIILEELKVFVVIKILFISFSFSNFSSNGTILWIYTTLAPWNHISLPVRFFLEKIQNFSLNLFKSSFFFNNLIIIINGDNKKSKLIQSLYMINIKIFWFVFRKNFYKFLKISANPHVSLSL